MAVFTPVTDAEIALWLEQYDVGTVRALRGIPSGIENTNFFLTTEKDGAAHDYVVTVFERLTHEQLPFYLYLMQHLAQHGICVPAPIPGRDGAILRTLKNKPATIVTRLPGRSNLAPTADECAIVGDMLARMHLAGRDYPRHQPNLRSLPWWNEVVPDILPFVEGATRELLVAELAHQQRFFAGADYAALPEGPCHCDLFRDNVLFEPAADGQPERLGGFFDFYFAGVDKWLFDVAVTVNDWCVDLATGALDAARARAMLRAYHAVRPFTDAEARHWQDMLRAAAYRFWVSRLWDFHLPRDAELLQPHDPTHFERVLRERVRAESLTLDIPEPCN
ncbi:homoserine kinase [Ralstonia solanacearum]|uniref:Homoserine kinase n=1 Tax=Ralstonia solanacearum TaxID=305 RepID=A0AAE3T6J8_RALSL|nr:homoserine kinase [Ralstonia solanacearum]MBB6581541.1 homoserine kinase [Ralstonia solanacearum]MDB0524667.1 homoserine kinase [Ralstonia solanacearum]